MTGTVKNDSGYVIGLIEWHLLNHRGQFDENSEYIYIADIWIHEGHRRSLIFQELIRIIDEHPFNKDTKFVYWDFLKDEHGKRIYDTRDVYQHLKQSRIYDRRYIADKILKREVLKCSS